MSLKRHVRCRARGGARARAAGARASLTTSETEQVRGYVASETHADRVRALVARPDLERRRVGSGDDVGARGGDARRPADGVPRRGRAGGADGRLAARARRGHRAGAAGAGRRPLCRSTRRTSAQSPALAEIARAYVFVAGEVSGRGPRDDRRDARRCRACARRSRRARGGACCISTSPCPVPSRGCAPRPRSSLLDAMPDGPTRRVDAADKLGAHRRAARGARRARGCSCMDATGADARVAERAGAARAASRCTRGGRGRLRRGRARALPRHAALVVATDDAPPGALAEAASPWATGGPPPAVEASTVVVARGLAEAAVRRAVDKRPALRASVERDGAPAVANAAAMLVVDAPRTLDVAAARSIAGKRETLAAVADALGVLAAFAPRRPGRRRARRSARPRPGHPRVARADGYRYRVPRRRSPLAHRPRSRRAPSWASSATVLRWRRRCSRRRASPQPKRSRGTARGSSSRASPGRPSCHLRGTSRRVVGSSVSDAISAPAPGDDVAVDADLHVDGGPGGIVVRALPGTVGFKGVSLLVVPGHPGTRPSSWRRRGGRHGGVTGRRDPCPRDATRAHRRARRRTSRPASAVSVSRPRSRPTLARRRRPARVPGRHPRSDRLAHRTALKRPMAPPDRRAPGRSRGRCAIRPAACAPSDR